MVLIFRKWQEWFAPVQKTSLEPRSSLWQQGKKDISFTGKRWRPTVSEQEKLNRSKVKPRRQVSKARSGSKCKARNRYTCNVAQARTKTQGPNFNAAPESRKRSPRKAVYHNLLFLEKTNVSLLSWKVPGLILSTSSLCSTSALIQCSRCTQAPDIHSHLISPHSFQS